MATEKITRQDATDAQVRDAALAPRDNATLIRRIKDGCLYFATFVCVIVVLAQLFGGSEDNGPSIEAVAANGPKSELVKALAVNFTRDFFQSSRTRPLDLSRYITNVNRGTLPITQQQFTNVEVEYWNPDFSDGDLSLWTVVLSGQLDVQADPASPRVYYQVPVSLYKNAPRAMDYPSPASAPKLGVDMPSGYIVNIDTNGPIADTVLGFVKAYITADGNIERYVTTDSNLQPVTPAPYSQVQFATQNENQGGALMGTDNPPLTDGATVSVRARIAAQTTATNQVVVPYRLTLTVISGRWQVAKIDAIPALDGSREQVSSTAPAPTTTEQAPAPTRN